MNVVKNIQLNPELGDIELGTHELNYSYHAEEKAANRNIRLDKTVTIVKGSIVEMEMDTSTGAATKLVVRESYNESYDRVLVLVPSAEGVKVVTVWLNHVDDNHATLKLKAI